MARIKLVRILEKDGTVHLVRFSRLADFLQEEGPNVSSCYSFVSSLSVFHFRLWKWRTFYFEDNYTDVYEKGCD